MLSKTQLAAYHQDGYVVVEGCFGEDEVAAMHASIPQVVACPTDLRMMEDDGKSVKIVYGVNSLSGTFARLCRQHQLLDPAKQILEHPVCIYQAKLNLKSAFEGSKFPWHQDFAFWHARDGLVEPRVVTAAVLLDEMSALNGPLCVLPGSHREGLIETPNFILDREAIVALSRRYPLVALTAPRGAVVFFHSNLVHGSPNNVSPFDRTIAYVTYNSVNNRLKVLERPSPEYTASRDYSAVEALPNGSLHTSDDTSGASVDFEVV